MNRKIIGSVILSLTIAALLTACGSLFSPSNTNRSGQRQGRGWMVWVRTSPCSGRFDWLSVAKEQQGGGLNFYVPYDQVLSRTTPACNIPGPDGCTFEEATAVMESLRGNDKFLEYCCRDYSVWRHSQTGDMTIVLGKFGNPGQGWNPVKGELCCEEAEDLAGMPGACSGGYGQGGGKGGRGWRVWIRTSPCSGRFDWLSVAKEQQGGGLNFYAPYETFLGSAGGECTLPEPNGCTFAEAMALMETLRGDKKFFDFCCRDYSVWKNTQTGEMTIVLGKLATAGFGWESVKGDLCCEEAEAIAGKPGACSGIRGGNSHQNPTNIPNTGGGNRRGSGGDACSCKNNCPDCEGLPSLLCVVEGESSQARACRQCMSRCQNGGSSGNDGNNDEETVETNQTPLPTPQTAGRWTLVSVTVNPETPPQGYNSYNAQSSSLSHTLYQGNKHDVQWTPPPPQIDGNGFTISLSAQASPIPGNDGATIIGIHSSGLTSDMPAAQQNAYAVAKSGVSASAQKSVTFKPTPDASEIEVKIGIMWKIDFIYKYRRDQ